MTRNIFYRDFTLCKAAALVGLIGAALMLGGVPKADPDIAGAVATSRIVVPVAWPDVTSIPPPVPSRADQTELDITQTVIDL